MFDNFKDLKNNSYILTKIIKVENEDVLDEIVYTSNRQTEVKYEAFSSANKFHKYLQEYYNSFPESERLFYERRSKQYDMNPNINKNKIVSLAAQTKDYVAVFLNEPHSTHRYYGEILESYAKRLYGQDDAVEPYFAAAYVYYVVDRLFKKNKIKKDLKNYKYHICYGLRVLLCGNKIVPGNSREIKSMSKQLIENVKDNRSFKHNIDTVCTCIEQIIKNERKNGELRPRSREFTKLLANEILTYTEKIAEPEILKKGDIVLCQVTAISKCYVNVILKTDDLRNRGSIHISEVANYWINNLSDQFNLGDRIQGVLISDYEENTHGWCISIKRLTKKK